MRLLAVFAVLLVLLLIAGFPARTYLDQQRALASTTERLEVLRKTNKALEARSKELHSDAAVERLAREQYNLVRPGEEAYAILPGPNAATPKAGSGQKAKPKRQSFWSKTVDTLSFWN
jgi:cell division protein FtsB